METAEQFSRNLQEFNSRLKEQRANIQELGAILDHYAQEVQRLDQASSLEELKVRILKEVEAAQSQETVASKNFNQGRLIGAALVTIQGFLSHQENPLITGVRSLQAPLVQDVHFGTVLVGVGEKGLPDGVAVVNLSRPAREMGRNEADIRGFLQAQGVILTEPQVFGRLVENLKEEVRKGSLSLPVSREQISKELADKITLPANQPEHIIS